MNDSSPFPWWKHMPGQRRKNEGAAAPPLAQMATSVIDWQKLVDLGTYPPPPWIPGKLDFTVEDAKNLCMNRDSFREFVTLYDTRRPANVHISCTRREYAPHLEQLEAWGKLGWETVSTESCEEASAFFPILKSSGLDTRPLWAAIPTNATQQPPFKLRIPTLHESIDLAFGSHPEDAELWGASMDMTSWFGQIPVSHEVAGHLRVSLYRDMKRRGLALCWQVLPQGWSWSPIISQRVSEQLLGGLEPCGILYDNYLLVAPGGVLRGE